MGCQQAHEISSPAGKNGPSLYRILRNQDERMYQTKKREKGK